MTEETRLVSPETALLVDGLAAEQGCERILQDVSFALAAGEIAVVLGPSGAGKTTLLRCLNGLQPAAAGTVEVLGFDIARGKGNGYNSINALRQDVGLVQQELFLWPHKTVVENLIEAPIRVCREPRDQARSRALGWLRRFGLEEKAHVLPHRLSQGQRQRVAICRALVMEPKMLLLDEVTSALDVEWSSMLGRTVKELAKGGCSFVIVTHQLGLANDISDHVLFLDGGRLLEFSPARRFFREPESVRARQFLRLASVAINR